MVPMERTAFADGITSARPCPVLEEEETACTTLNARLRRAPMTTYALEGWERPVKSMGIATERMDRTEFVVIPTMANPIIANPQYEIVSEIIKTACTTGNAQARYAATTTSAHPTQTATASGVGGQEAA